MSVNKVFILGRLGRDPVLKYTPSGAAVCNFTLATNEKWKDKSGEMKEKTEWSTIIVWGKSAEYAGLNLRKGARCFVEGKLATRSWDDKSGSKRYATEIIADQVQIIDRLDPAETEIHPTVDDLPF